MTTNRPLRVFLCHSSADKPAVRELYQKLRAEPWIEPWLDEEELFPGMDWNLEIEKAVEAADAIIVCLSKGSITKEGYVQRELRIVLDYADYKPEGTLYLMPVRLEECDPPRRLRPWQYADYFEGNRERALQRLLVSLKRRADSLGLKYEPVGRVSNLTSKVETKESQAESKPAQKGQKKDTPPTSQATNLTYESSTNKITLSNGMEFMRVPAGVFLMGNNNHEKDEKPQHPVEILYDYWMSRNSVTNEKYNVFVEFYKIEHPVHGWKKKKDHPVVWVSWEDVLVYCQWLNYLLNAELPAGLMLRLPTEAEWEKAARGTDGREYPWGNTFDKNKCNVYESGKGGTTSVDYYSPESNSPYGCADMAGNVWEWTHSLYKGYPYKVNDGREIEKTSGRRVLRGGSFFPDEKGARCTSRFGFITTPFVSTRGTDGFRICIAPPLPK